MMTARLRRSFTQEFKAHTVELVRTSGKSVGEICRDLDLTETAVRRWVAQTDIDAGRRDGLTTAEREELVVCGGRTGFFVKNAKSYEKPRPFSPRSRSALSRTRGRDEWLLCLAAPTAVAACTGQHDVDGADPGYSQTEPQHVRRAAHSR